MGKVSRRNWIKISGAGLTAFCMPASLSAISILPVTPVRKEKVVIGIQTYSFRDRDLDEAIEAISALNIASCELWQGHLQPRKYMWRRDATAGERKEAAEGLKKWRQELNMTDIITVKKKLNDAGIAVQAFNGTFNRNYSDAEFEQVFEIANTLGSDTITTSTTVDLTPRIDEFAKKFKVKVGMHNHSNVQDPNQFATPVSFERALRNASEYIRINLDIGHFTAAGYDAAAFVQQHHDTIVCVHLKDRKVNQGPRVPFGEGDAPIGKILRMIRDNEWDIPANIEYEYEGTDALAEVKKCLAYCVEELRT